MPLLSFRILHDRCHFILCRTDAWQTRWRCVSGFILSFIVIFREVAAHKNGRGNNRNLFVSSAVLINLNWLENHPSNVCYMKASKKWQHLRSFHWNSAFVYMKHSGQCLQNFFFYYRLMKLKRRNARLGNSPTVASIWTNCWICPSKWM